MLPDTVNDTRKKAAPRSRKLVLGNTRTAKKARIAENTTIRPVRLRTRLDHGEYLPESHLNAQYQLDPRPAMVKHRMSHQGCRAFTSKRSFVIFPIRCVGIFLGSELYL